MRKTRWGIVFYGLKSKLLAYYRLGSKDPTGSSTLDALGKFIAEHGIPRRLLLIVMGGLGLEKYGKIISGDCLFL